MESKTNRLNISIENILEKAKDCLEYAENEYCTGKITNKNYELIVKKVNSIITILPSLKFSKSFEDDRLNEIRIINLSIKSLYDENEYDDIMREVFKTHGVLCFKYKEEDIKKINYLKKTFNSLPKFYQTKLTKNDTMHEGVDFLFRKYINDKYGLKALKYNPVNISDTYLQQIDEYTKIIESKENDNSLKDTYVNLREYTIKLAKAEIIITKLRGLRQLCDEKIYFDIDACVAQIISKYKKVYEENKQKYDLEIQKLSSNNFSSQKRQNDINELKNLLHSITLEQAKFNGNKDIDIQETSPKKR